MALTVKHLFPFLKLMKALNIKDEIRGIAKKTNVEGWTEEDVKNFANEKGIEMVFALMDKMPNAEAEIKAFLSIYSGQTLEEIEALPISEFVNLIKQFFAEPEFKSFFKQAVK